MRGMWCLFRLSLIFALVGSLKWNSSVNFIGFCFWHFSSLCRCIIVIYFRFIADCIIRLNLRRDGDIFAVYFVDEPSCSLTGIIS